MKLLTEQEIENLSDSMQRKLDITRKVWTFKDGFKSGYTQAQQDLLESASEGFEEFLNSKIEDLVTESQRKEYRLWINEFLSFWQACALSHAKKMQEKDAKLTSISDEELKSEFLKRFLSIQKENQEMREALNQAVKILEEGCLVYDRYVPSGSSSFRVEADMFIKDVSKCYNLSETPNSSKEGV